MWLWLPPAVVLALIVPAHRGAYAAEEGTRAGAEPAMAGIFAVAPLVTVLLVQLACAGFALDLPPRGVRWCLVGSTVAALVPALLAGWLTVMHVRNGYAWTDHGGMLLVVSALVGSTVPGWVAAWWLPRPAGETGGSSRLPP